MLCSFALRDEPASRKPLRVTKLCVACRYYFFSSSFFALSTFYALLRGSIPIVFTRTVLRLSYALFSPRVLMSNIEQTSQCCYWLSGHAKMRPDSLTTKFYWQLPRDDNFPLLSTMKNYEARNAALHDRATYNIVNVKRFFCYRNFITTKITSLFLRTTISLIFLPIMKVNYN